MVTVADLILPRKGIVIPEPPSYIKLDMAFGLGTGAKLGDKSRYRSHGTISGADWATGAHGYCLDFDSSVPDYVEIPAAHTQLNFTSENFSIIARVNIESFTKSGCFFVRGKENEDGYEFLTDSVGRMYLRTSQSGAAQMTYTAVGALAIATWYTVGISRDGAVITIYRNGVALSVTSGTHIDPATCARAARIGILDDETSRPLDGKMEFLRIIGDKALTASEHLAYHNALA